jgi:hypothetical protein
MSEQETITNDKREKTMVEGKIYMELVKKDLTESLSIQGLKFEQVHYILRQAVEKILLYGEVTEDKKYTTEISKYHERNKEIEAEREKHAKDYNDCNEQLSLNDKKMFEAIQKL